MKIGIKMLCDTYNAENVSRILNNLLGAQRTVAHLQRTKLVSEKSDYRG